MTRRSKRWCNFRPDFRPGARVGFGVGARPPGYRGGGGGGGGVEVTDPLEPADPAQMAAAWGGYLIPGNCTDFWDCNESAGPLNPTWGTAALTAIGSPTFGVVHPHALDSYDRSVSTTDAAAVQIGAGNGAITFGANWGCAWVDWASAAGAPAADRQLFGNDALTDVIFQFRATTGRPRGIFLGNAGGTIVTPEIAVNHFDTLRHTVGLIWRPGGEARCFSDLGIGATVSLAAVGSYDLVASWHIYRNNVPPAGTVFCHGIFKSDGSTAQNNAFQALWDNLAAAVLSWRTTTGQV